MKEHFDRRELPPLKSRVGPEEDRESEEASRWISLSN